jgi:hypothetical protein
MSTSVELGYAQTVHGAQGATVDHALLIVDRPIDGRALYVGMTRGAESNDVYVAVDANHAARDILDAAINNDWTDTPAIEIRAELEARPVTPVVPSVREPATVGLPAEELRAVHAEHRSLQRMLLPSHEQLWQRLECADVADGRQLEQAHAQRDALARQLATVTAQRAVLPAFGHKHERQDLDHKIKQLHQQRVTASRDIANIAHRIEQRTRELATERRWAAEHAGLGARERELDHALSIDAGARGHAVTQDPPGYLTRSLGPVPADPEQRTTWEHAAGTMEQYRALHDIIDPHRALGPELDRYSEPSLAWERERITQEANQIRELSLDRGIERHLGLILGR